MIDFFKGLFFFKSFSICLKDGWLLGLFVYVIFIICFIVIGIFNWIFGLRLFVYILWIILFGVIVFRCLL